jgi:hypothetical protein
LLAGRGFSALGLSSRAGLAVAVLVVALPLWRSAGVVAQFTQPTPWDRAVDELLVRAEPGASVLTAIPELGLDRDRFQVLRATGDATLDRLLLEHASYYVGASSDPPAIGLAPLAGFGNEQRPGGSAAYVFRMPAAARARYRELALTGAQLATNASGSDLELLRDGQLETFWLAGPQRPGQELTIVLPTSVRLGQIEIDLGRRPARGSRSLEVQISEDGTTWRGVPFVDVTEDPDRTAEPPSRQILLIEPRLVRGLRLVQTGRSDRRWGIAELHLRERLDEREDAFAGANAPRSR